MAEEQKAILSEALNNLVDKLDRRYLRQMQVQMHQCAIKCWQDNDISYKSAIQCTENCSLRLKNSQQYFNAQIENFNTRLDRCAAECQDEVRDKVSGRPTDAQVNMLEKYYDNCVKKCLEKAISQVPNLYDKVAIALNKDEASETNIRKTG